MLQTLKPGSRWLTRNRSAATQQRGSSLVFSLVILTAITLGAVVAMQRSTLQLRMIGNMQHQQTIFNDTMGNLNTLLNGLRNGNIANQILGDMINTENTSIANGNPPGTAQLNPYLYNLLPQPPQNAGTAATTNNIRMLYLPGNAPQSLKLHESSSAGTLVPYYFASNALGVDVNNQSRSRQEAGFFYMAPAPQ
ncbi:MAG: hypothetical protein LRY66_13250 [Saccharospirillaceae bacterium]|nr:hypothetical protein [Saccharospirillaceae bacterium]MCD8532278.1 hypothetical protein [Saccharospirillaceae bacterium]